LKSDAESTEPVKATISERWREGKVGRVFRHRDFRLLWGGAFVSFSGSWIQTVAQQYLVYEMTKSYALLGSVAAANMLPTTFLGPFLGSITDMFDRRKLLVICQSIFALCALFLAAATYFQFIQYWHVIVVALITGTTGVIEIPTRQSIISRVVPPGDLANAIPLNALTFNIARPLGSAVGGVLLASIGVSACYLVNGLTFAGLIFAGLAIKADLSATAREPQPIWDLLSEGFLYTFREPRLRALLIAEGMVSIFGLFYMTQTAAIASDMLSRPKDLGLLLVAQGFGSIIALVIVLSISHLRIKGFLIQIAVLMIGGMLITLGFADSLLVGLVIYFLLGIFTVTIFNTVNTLFQTLAPERLRGRVISMHNWALGGLGAVGAIMLGAFASRFTLPLAIQMGGVVVVLTGCYLFLTRRALEGV
jgi:MFS family permease